MGRFPVLLAMTVAMIATGPAHASDAEPNAADFIVDGRLCLEAAGDVDDLLGRCTSAIQSQLFSGEGLTWLYNNRALLEARSRKFDAAFTDFQKAMELTPTLAFLYVNRAQVRVMHQEEALALEDLNRALELDPVNSPALINRASIYNRRGDSEHAFRDLNAAVKSDPASPVALYNRGNMYLQRRQVALALADYDETIRLDSRHWRGYEGRGDVELIKGEFDAAIADYTIAIQGLGETRAVVQRCFARKMAKKDLDLALEDCNSAVHESPDAGYYLYVRGCLYLQMDRITEAIADFDSLLVLAPEFAFARYGRGLARQKAGDAAGLTDISTATAAVPDVVTRFGVPDVPHGWGQNHDMPARASSARTVVW